MQSFFFLTHISSSSLNVLFADLIVITIFFPALSNAFIRGTVIGWVAPTVFKLKNGEYNISATDQELSWVASAHFVGRFVGPLLMTLILDRVGRKFSIMIGCFSFLILWLLMFFVHSIILIIALRLVMGVFLGMFDVVNFVYLAENCTPKMRGIMGSFILVCSNTGTLIEQILTTYTCFSTASAVNLVICLCLCVTTLFVKETPYFLVMKGRHEEAKQNLLWLRGKSTSDKETTGELDRIQQNMQSEMLKKRSLIVTLKSPENYRPILLTMISASLLFLAGSAAVGAFSTMIFLPSSTFSKEGFTLLMSFFDVVCSFIFPFIVEKFNRRTLLLLFMLIICIGSACTFILFSMEFIILKEWLPWMIFTVVTLQYVISGWAVNALGIMRGELLPISVKGIGSCLSVMANSICTGLSTKIFLPVFNDFGKPYNFLIFLISSSINFVYIFKMLPETRGKTLVDIQLSLQDGLLSK